MAKFFTYLMISIGLALLFSMLGIGAGSGYLQKVLSVVSTPANISDFFSAYIKYIALLAALVAGISVGFVSFSKTDMAITAMLAGASMLIFIWDFISILTFIQGIPDNEWVYPICLLIMAPLSIGYIVSLYDWVRGAYN